MRPAKEPTHGNTKQALPPGLVELLVGGSGGVALDVKLERVQSSKLALDLIGHLRDLGLC